MNDEQIKLCVKIIVEDLSDRYGLRQAWEKIDDDTKCDVVAVWEEIIREVSRDE